METESLSSLAVNTLCPVASNAIAIGSSPPVPRFTSVTVLSVRSIMETE